VSNIAGQRDLRSHWFAGTWYTRYRLRGTGTWDSGKVYLEPTSDNDFQAFYAFAE
jgi:hypothetical protein